MVLPRWTTARYIRYVVLGPLFCLQQAIILHIDLLFIASSTLAYVTATGLAFAPQWLRRDFILSFFESKEKQVQKLYMSRV